MLDALVERSGAAPDQIEDVIMGCVMQAGEQSNNVARNAIMASKLPESVPGTSIDRQCGSSQQALHFAPQAAYANIQKLRSLYPDSYTRDGGFYDAVNPTTGQVGHRRLVLDQSMIMAALDNALNHRQLQRWFAADKTAAAARAVLGAERMTL